MAAVFRLGLLSLLLLSSACGEANTSSLPAPGADFLLLAIHGAGPDEDPSVWAEDFVERVSSATVEPDRWQFHAYDWTQRSANQATAPTQAAFEGAALGAWLLESGYDHVHLVGHSAGAGVVESALLELPPSEDRALVVHATFLDPFSLFPADFGANADYAESWFNTDDGAPGSDAPMPRAFNVDVTMARPAAFDERAHWWPIEAYLETVGPLSSPGFGDSLEAGGFLNAPHQDRPRGDLVEYEPQGAP